MKAEDLTILVDTREQKPLCFPNMPSERTTLRTADYSVRGPDFDLRDTVLIERKSVADLVGSLGGGRERFARELERRRAVRWRFLVVEGDLREIAAGHRFSGLTPLQIVSPLLAWPMKYGIHLIPAPDRAWAARMVELILGHAARYALTKDGKRDA